MTADTRPVHSGSRRPCRRTLLLFLCLLTTLSALLSAGVLTAAAEEPPASTDVGVVLLLNLENNLTLYEKEADTNVYPSSSVKIMMGLLACRSLSDRLDEEATVTAAKAMGVRERSIVFRHIMPNILSLILVSATLDFATCMLTESTLSYLGFGIAPPTPTWGNMLTGANNSVVIQQYWWRWVFPATVFGICTICINLVGDALRDAVDPKTNGR